MEDDARGARRALWIFRLVFYPCALAAAVLLIAWRTADGPPPITAHAGSTSQGHRFFAGYADDGFPVFDPSGDFVAYFDTTVIGSCTDGGSWTLHWVAERGHPDPFVSDGNRLRVDHEGVRQYGAMTSEVRLVLDATADGGELRGTIRYRERFSPPGEQPFECSAEGIRFSVQR